MHDKACWTTIGSRARIETPILIRTSFGSRTSIPRRIPALLLFLSLVAGFGGLWPISNPAATATSAGTEAGSGAPGRSEVALNPEDVPPPAWAPVPFLRPADFMLYMQQQHGWAKEDLDALFAGYQANSQVIRLMDPAAPGFKRSWQAYRKRFIEAKRIAYGKAFWDENASALERASRRFGVPPYVVVGIIGVESIYGRNTGNFPVLEALSTLSFDYPRRAAYFAKELEHFLLWTREHGVDPTAVRGSFAGAIGLPQFMPGSIRRHAVDFDGDGTVDLSGSPADAIGSVASFLRGHGWDASSAQALRKILSASAEPKAKALLDAGWRPHASRQAIEDSGLRFPADDSGTNPGPEAQAQFRWAVFELPNADAPSTWIATDHNFWVITRYNQSPFYAMAVLELGEAVRAERLHAKVATRKPPSSNKLKAQKAARRNVSKT